MKTVPLSLCAGVSLMVGASACAVPMKDLTTGAPAAERTYKTVGNEPLKLFYFVPSGPGEGSSRQAVVWIHGGAWVGGTTDGFMPHARYCAARGAVGFNITYRLAQPGGPTIADCIADCKSALRYVRAHAAEFGVNPRRIAVAGDSAGGHLAACLGVLDGFDDPADDLSVSARPDAMLLFNPIVDLSEGDWLRFAVGGNMLTNQNARPERSPENLARARSLSPVFHVRSNQPPTLLMHGLADRIVDPAQARRFAAAMQQVGNRCDLVLLENAGHAFDVAFWKAPESLVVESLRTADRFLVSVGFWEGAPTLQTSPGEPAWTPIQPRPSPGSQGLRQPRERETSHAQGG